MLANCTTRIAQQRAFDSQPLAAGLCYACGKVMWNPSHAHYSNLIPPPNGMTVDDAPATAYLKAAPNSNLSFIKGKGDHEKWLCCSFCKNHTVPTDQQWSAHTECKPVSLWDMRKPDPLVNLANHYELSLIHI